MTIWLEVRPVANQPPSTTVWFTTTGRPARTNLPPTEPALSGRAARRAGERRQRRAASRATRRIQALER